MKHILLSFFLLFTFIDNNAQQKITPVTLIESWEPNEKVSELTDSLYVVKRLDTTQFLSMLNKHDKIIIEFWQPWCSGSLNTIPNCKKLLNACSESGITFILISDSRFDKEYFKIDSLKAGIVVLYFNKYKINFTTYIISSDMGLEDYRKLIYQYTSHKPVKRNFCFYLEDKKLVYHNYGYHFYKKDVKKILKRVSKNKVTDTHKKGFTLNLELNTPFKYFTFNLY